MTTNELNKNAELIAGELADIDLPQPPPMDWSWLFDMLFAFVGFGILLVLLIGFLRFNQNRNQAAFSRLPFTQFVIPVFSLWRLKSIKKQGLGAIELYQWHQSLQPLIVNKLASQSDLFNEVITINTALSKAIEKKLFAKPVVSRETTTGDSLEIEGLLTQAQILQGAMQSAIFNGENIKFSSHRSWQRFIALFKSQDESSKEPKI